MNANHVTVAVVQAGSIPFNTRACVDKAVALIADAAAEGAKIVVFPEAFITGYPKGLSFGMVVGARDAAGRDEFRQYLEQAITVPGPEVDTLAKAAADAGCFVVMGVIEREHSTCYCTALFLAPDGALAGKHRKVMPTAMERTIWGFGDGSTLSVVDTPYGKIGAVICWENYMPMLRMTMYSKGITIYCAPTVDDRNSWAPTMQHIAMEGRCFVLSSCQFLRRSDVPEGLRRSELGADNDVLIRGGSMIVDPLGKVLAGPHFGSETILMATLDLREVPRARFDFDVVGHYSRPDIFRLAVNEDAVSAVTISRSLPEP